MTQKNGFRLPESVSRNVVTFPCIALCIIMILILGIVNLVPDAVTQILRPLFIAICFVIPGFGFYSSGNFKWLAILMVVYALILVFHPMTRNALTVFISLETFALFFFFAGTRIWTGREVGLILKTVCFACAFEAVVILYSNTGLLRNSSSQHISFFGATLNRNPAAFSIAPGAVCGMILMFYDKKNVGRMRFIFYTGMTLICAFCVFSLGCRSAFFAMSAGAFLIAWQRCANYSSSGKTAGLRILLVLFAVAIVFASAHFSEGSYSERLFDFTGKLDDSGRTEIWEKTWVYIMQNPVFGGGFDNFPPDLKMGTHNSFLTVMLYSGFIGGGLMAITIGLFFLESLRCHSWIPAAFMIQTMMHSYTEPNFDYYAYIPMILAVIVLRYLEYQSTDLRTLYRDRKVRRRV